MKKEIEKINDTLSCFIDKKRLNTLKMDSRIITDIEEMKFILDKIEKQSFKKIKELKLLYRASENQGSSTLFHQKCDGKTPTIVIIHSKNNYKFGGFTKKSWSSSNPIEDDDAFCFSINLKKIYNIIKGKRAIASGDREGPIFYGDSYNFIQISGENAFSGNYINIHSCKKNANYEGVENDFEISGGEQYFKLLDYEVFQIID